MKIFHLFIIVAATFLIFVGIVSARPINYPSFQERLDKSDLIVVAKPISTHDKPEQSDPREFSPRTMVGLSTEFDVSLVVKGDKGLKKIILHHYRYAKPEYEDPVDGLGLASFDFPKKKSYLLFLKKESDGRYAPINGQLDPMGIAIMRVDNMDMIVTARPISAKKPADKLSLPGSPIMTLTGFQTEFAVQDVMKGDKSLKKFVLHHYERSGTNMASVTVDFKPDPNQLYLMFLKKERDGRFTPAPDGEGETTDDDFPIVKVAVRAK